LIFSDDDTCFKGHRLRSSGLNRPVQSGVVFPGIRNPLKRRCPDLGKKGGRMLVLTRRSEESIRLGEDIVVKVFEIKGNQVRLGIEAPRE